MGANNRKMMGSEKGQSVIEVTIFGVFFAILLVILQKEATDHKKKINYFKNKGFNYEQRTSR